MAIVRHTNRMPMFTTPWRELDDLLTNRLGRLADEGWSGINQSPTGDWVPSVNVDESKDELVLTAELPGMTEADVEIELENNILTIKGEKLQETRKDESRVHLFERRYGAFLRSFTLPRTVNAEGIEATFRNGVLTVHMPKVAGAKGRKISVKSES